MVTRPAVGDIRIHFPTWLAEQGPFIGYRGRFWDVRHLAILKDRGYVFGMNYLGREGFIHPDDLRFMPRDIFQPVVGRRNPLNAPDVDRWLKLLR